MSWNQYFVFVCNGVKVKGILKAGSVVIRLRVHTSTSKSKRREVRFQFFIAFVMTDSCE